MKYLLLPLFGLFMAIHAYGAAIDILRPMKPPAMLNADCDTILMTSGVQFEGEIIEEKEDEFKIRLCDQDRLLLIKKSNIEEIRAASGEIRWMGAKWQKQLPTQEGAEESYDPKERRKNIQKGITLILLSLALVLPFGYLAFLLAFGGADFLAILSLLVPLAVLIWGIAKLSKGLSMRRQKKKGKR